ncbi:MAG: hypothetical protein CVT75_03965 [Alphaproteobacteria bacterium HGW-Alphaproteobacteria-14]|nr:MAG: hypothetical protein CVT75_03965 [Alphaproteobacteria bacterium HGW-Alphaproteobacteria-14]
MEVIELPGADCPVAIVDGLAATPERWREQAVGGDYAHRGDFYPGQRKPVDPAYFQDIGQRLGAIMRSVFGCRNSLKVDRALYSIVSTQPDQLSLAQCIPHIDDVAPGSYAMVHYLAHTAFGGTAFYRQRSTGFAQVAAAQHRTYLAALESDLAAHGRPAPGYIQGDTLAFAQIGSVDFAYNRAVIYPGNLLHCSIARPDVGHPDDPLAGRLTIAGFFHAD